MSLMLEEIRQQPEALENTLRSALRPIEDFRGRLQADPPALVVLVARGTSDNAALFARYLIEITTGIPVALAAPSVSTLYGAPIRWGNALVVGISQSGESTDINLYLEAARNQGARTLGVTNEAGSAITRVAGDVLLVRAGREKSVAATKTYSGQVLILYLLAWALGASYPLRVIERLPELARRALRLENEVAELAERYRFMTNAVVMGRGLLYANAFEFALKLMETCYVVAERFSGADFAHGPIALVEKAFPVIVFAPPGPTRAGTLAMLGRLRQLEAETLVLCQKADTEAASLATRSIRLAGRLPSARGRPDDLLAAIPYIVPAQLFAAHLAREKGLDPDRPRALSKVTKTI